MKQKRHTTEEIIRILRETDAGKNVEAVCREHNVTTTSYYCWKKAHAGEGWSIPRRRQHSMLV
jgi:transposase-like protein